MVKIIVLIITIAFGVTTLVNATAQIQTHSDHLAAYELKSS